MKILGLILAFVLVAILIFLSLAFVDSVPIPTNETVKAQYDNLSATTDMVYSGLDMVMLLFLGTMVIVGILMFVNMVLK